MSKKVRVNLAALVAKAAKKRGSAYTIEEVARGSDLSRVAVKGWLDGKVRKAEFDTIEKLLAYLGRQGLDVGLCDLLVEEEVGG